jgi:hypothetical protein
MCAERVDGEAWVSPVRAGGVIWWTPWLLAASAKTDRKNVSSALCGAPCRASEDAYVADDVFRGVRPYPKRKYGSGALEGGSGHQTKREGSSGYQSEGKGY